MENKNNIIIQTDPAGGSPHSAYSWFKKTRGVQHAEMLKQGTGTKMAELRAILEGTENHQGDNNRKK